MNWYKLSQINHSRVKAKDYFQLMRELDSGVKNVLLLNKMIYDLEPAVMTIYLNTVAMGHTSSEMEYPCPDCNTGSFTVNNFYEIIMMKFYDSKEGIPEEDLEYASDNLLKALEGKPYGGIFCCEQCGKIMTFDEIDALLDDPTGTEFHARGSLMSDQIEQVLKLFIKARDGKTFEDKFPYFEAVIEYVHRSGGISHFFIEGGEDTINRYRDGQVI